jgi:hypothetical protein
MLFFTLPIGKRHVIDCLIGHEHAVLVMHPPLTNVLSLQEVYSILAA